MKLFRLLVIGVSALVASPLPARQKSPASEHPPSIFTPQLFAALRAADLRLATIAYRLSLDDEKRGAVPRSSVGAWAAIAHLVTISAQGTRGGVRGV